MSIIKFPPFRKYACEGDKVSVNIGGITLEATIYRDEDCSKPDERDDGFWPSLDPTNAGFIGEGKTRRQFQCALNKARKVMKAWENDEWWYCGVAVTAWRGDKQLTPTFSNACWGIECNYPSRTGNAYLNEVASEEAIRAMAEAWVLIDDVLSIAGSRLEIRIVSASRK